MGLARYAAAALASTDAEANYPPTDPVPAWIRASMSQPAHRAGLPGRLPVGPRSSRGKLKMNGGPPLAAAVVLSPEGAERAV